MTIAEGITLENKALIKKYNALFKIRITSLETWAYSLFQKQVPALKEILTSVTTASQIYGFSC